MKLQEELDWVCRSFDAPLPAEDMDKCIDECIKCVSEAEGPTLSDRIAAQRAKLAKLLGKNPGHNPTRAEPAKEAPDKETAQPTAGGPHRIIDEFISWLDEVKRHYPNPKTAERLERLGHSIGKTLDGGTDGDRVVAALQRWATAPDVGGIASFQARMKYAKDEYNIAAQYGNRLKKILGLQDKLD